MLSGDEGDDIVMGGAGNDTLSGGIGNDVLSGDTRESGDVAEYSPFQLGIEFHASRITAETTYYGVDTLHGGAGDDQLIGGGGSDFSGVAPTTMCSRVTTSRRPRARGRSPARPRSLLGSIFSQHALDPDSIHGNDQLHGEGGDDSAVRRRRCRLALRRRRFGCAVWRRSVRHDDRDELSGGRLSLRRRRQRLHLRQRW